MGARSATEARAFFIARLRRSLPVVIAREMARHRLRRIPFIGVPGLRAAIADRSPQRAQQGEGVQPTPHTVRYLHTEYRGGCDTGSIGILRCWGLNLQVQLRQ